MAPLAAYRASVRESCVVGGIGSESRWLAAQPARVGEQVLARRPANHTQGRRAVGGALFLTDTRLVFCPNRLDTWLGGRGWAAELADVTGVDVCPRTGGLFDGGMVARLRVHLRGDAAELFVTKQPSQVARLLQTRIASLAPVEPPRSPSGGPGSATGRLVGLRARHHEPARPARDATVPRSS